MKAQMNFALAVGLELILLFIILFLNSPFTIKLYVLNFKYYYLIKKIDY